MAVMTFAERSIETQWLIERLAALAVGELVPYADLSRIIGRDVQHAGRGCLASARRILERDDQLLFDVVPNVGLQRASSPEVLAIGRRGLQHVHRSAAKVLSRLARCCDRSGLTTDDRTHYDLASARAGLIVAMGRPSVQRRLAERIEQAMPPSRYLDALKDLL